MAVFALVISLISCPSLAPVKEPALRKELLQRAERDQQAMREAMLAEASGENLGTGENGTPDGDPFQSSLAVLLDNTAWMKEVIRTRGWPTFDLVGRDGSAAAWLLVQHGDLELQQMSLPLLEEAVQFGRAERSNHAYLLDRVLVREGKKQVYGTQLDLVDGRLVPFPIEDEAGVDARRKAIGLDPLADYIRKAQETVFQPR